MTISVLDLKAQYSTIKEEIHRRIEEVCENMAFSNGPYVRSFEKNFAEFCSMEYAIAVSTVVPLLCISR